MEQRRTRRFTLQLPVSVTRNGAERIPQFGLTKNISSGGVLFTVEREPEIGASIEYLISLGGSPDQQKTALRCIGKVLRANRTDADSAYDIAATLERYEFVRPED